MEKFINKFLEELIKNNRKRFEINDLENFIINKLKSHESYLNIGGYNSFFNVIIKLKNEGVIREISSSSYNGMNPPLKRRWTIVKEDMKNKWNNSQILKYSNFINFSYYIKNPEYQNDMEWEYIKNIYEFLKERDTRDIVSVEERSLELFYDEKFLLSNKILNRVSVSYEDLKMKKYGEMFIYWNRGIENIKRIIILENHSIFFTYKRIIKDFGRVFDFSPDALIYGEGKKIEKSFEFIEEIIDKKEKDGVEIFYFGDIDPEGISIYIRLKERYNEFNIRLHKEGYKFLISNCNRKYFIGNQRKNEEHFKKFVIELEDFLEYEEINFLMKLWNENLRVPQELLTFENFPKLNFSKGIKIW